jgi:DNA mismatch endonuclease, patch repair protein
MDIAMDNLTIEQRRYCMSRIRSSNTKIELTFRRLLWGTGYKGYRAKAKLPGKPDIYFPKRNLVVFIDGCFWHKCPKCFIRPKSKNEYWDNKIDKNVERDIKTNSKLNEGGINTLRFWEHEIKEDLLGCLEKFISKYEKKGFKNN